MTSEFSYSTTFILSKSYFTECFEQSAKVETFFQAYFKALFFSIFGGLLVIFTPLNPYVAWFLFALGIVEALSVRYKRAWWVARQMLGKASKGEVTLLLNEEGIKSHSFYIDEMLPWKDITMLSHTDKGWIFHHAKGKTYISSSFLNNDAVKFLTDKEVDLNSSVLNNNNV